MTCPHCHHPAPHLVTLTVVGPADEEGLLPVAVEAPVCLACWVAIREEGRLSAVAGDDLPW